MIDMAERVNRTDLSDLLAEGRLRLGPAPVPGKPRRALSLRAMALRCVDPENPDAGAVVDHNWIDRLEKNTLQRRPTPVELRGLANGLDLDPKVVTAAAAAQYFEAGTPQESTDDVVTISDPTGEISALVHAYTRLTGQDRPKIFDLMDELNSQQGKGGSADSAKSDGS